MLNRQKAVNGFYQITTLLVINIKTAFSNIRAKKHRSTLSKFNFFGNCIKHLNLTIGSIHLKTYKTLALILYLINPLG